jgi:hypothetical protein
MTFVVAIKAKVCYIESKVIIYSLISNILSGLQLCETFQWLILLSVSFLWINSPQHLGDVSLNELPEEKYWSARIPGFLLNHRILASCNNSVFIKAGEL